MLLATYSAHHHEEHSEGWVDSLLHNPWMAIFWVIIGILTMVLGVKDYKHHKKCKSSSTNKTE
jgi:hypothetical protein